MTGRTRFLPLTRLHTELVAAPLALLTGGLLLAMPTLADISYVQGTAFSSNFPIAVLSRSFSSAQQAGNLIVVMVASKDMMSIQSVTDSMSNTVTRTI